MGFEGLLGNDRLKQQLSAGLQNNRISHGYLISGAPGSGKRTLARLLAAAAICRESERPCLRCENCRKVLQNSHPDVITVDDPEKKTVSVALIREARTDIYVRPNEAERKIYLFPRAQDMTVEAQNALLKVLEEPPQYGVFLLMADQPESLLPTVRSRCVELKMLPLPENLLRKTLMQEFPEAQPEGVSAAVIRSGGFLGQAKEQLSEGAQMLPQTRQLAESYAAGDALGVLQVLTAMEKWKRDALIDCLQQWIRVLGQSLTCRAGLPAESEWSRKIGAVRSALEIHNAVAALQKAVEYAKKNVSPAAVCGWLSWELR